MIPPGRGQAETKSSLLLSWTERDTTSQLTPYSPINVLHDFSWSHVPITNHFISSCHVINIVNLIRFNMNQLVANPEVCNQTKVIRRPYPSTFTEGFGAQ
mmetsp:Transcript_29336/g.61107  ORF Transcript_29336/g.61107 Transcript_29336/m.61107 type:complete len:100 (+) Transcript_29336:159-458(+)